MAVGTFTLYAKNLDKWDTAVLAAGTIKCALVNSSYTPNFAYNGDSAWADASANEIGATGDYATATVGSPTSTGVSGGYKFSSNNVSWVASGGNISAWRRAVFYYSGTLGGVTNPLIGAFLGDSTPADVPATVSGFTLLLTCPANGWFTVTTS